MTVDFCVPLENGQCLPPPPVPPPPPDFSLIWHLINEDGSSVEELERVRLKGCGWSPWPTDLFGIDFRTEGGDHFLYVLVSLVFATVFIALVTAICILRIRRLRIRKHRNSSSLDSSGAHSKLSTETVHTWLQRSRQRQHQVVAAHQIPIVICSDNNATNTMIRNKHLPQLQRDENYGIQRRTTGAEFKKGSLRHCCYQQQQGRTIAYHSHHFPNFSRVNAPLAASTMMNPNSTRGFVRQHSLFSRPSALTTIASSNCCHFLPPPSFSSTNVVEEDDESRCHRRHEDSAPCCSNDSRYYEEFPDEAGIPAAVPFILRQMPPSQQQHHATAASFIRHPSSRRLSMCIDAEQQLQMRRPPPDSKPPPPPPSDSSQIASRNAATISTKCNNNNNDQMEVVFAPKIAILQGAGL